MVQAGINKFAHRDKKSGDLIESKDWNASMNEVVRLEGAKVNRQGVDSLQGPLTIQEALGIGNVSPNTMATGGSRLKIAQSDADQVDVRFSTIGAGLLEIVGWDKGWNLNVKTGGKHLHLNRDATAESDVYIGRQGQEIVVRGADGNVGIGTPTPGSKLEVNGLLKANSATITGTLNTDTLNVNQRVAVAESMTIGALNFPGGNLPLSVAGAIQAEQMIGQTYRCEVPVLQFDGTDDYVDLGNAAHLNPGNQSCTIELWFKCDRTINENILYNKENLYEAAVVGGYFQFAWQSRWDWTGGTTFPVTSGEWHHAAIVYDRTSQKVYKNGELVFTNTQPSDIGTNTSKLLIAARGNTSPRSFFRGNIREFRIWNVSRSQAELQSSMNLTLNGNETGLIGYWRINEGFGTQIQDETANQHNGTVQGAVWSSMRSRFTHDSIAFSGAQTFQGDDTFIQQINQAQEKVLQAQTALAQAKQNVQTTQLTFTEAETLAARASSLVRARQEEVARLTALVRGTPAFINLLAIQTSLEQARQQLTVALQEKAAADSALETARIQLALAQARQTEAEQALQAALSSPVLAAISYKIGIGQANSLVYDSFQFHRWRTRGVERMHINDNGQLSITGAVGIGTLAPEKTLHIVQNAASDGIRLDERSRDGNLTKRFFKIAYEGQGNIHFYHQNDIGQWMNLNGDWTKNSDISLKENISGLDSILDKVMELRPVHFTWKNNHMDDIGFIAQEVERVFPELVSSTTVEGQARKGIGYTAFGVLAIRAIQEMYDKIEALQAYIQILEAQK
jgi:Concanavalin A-like lectin/glucanases superfamily/Chaperone of endosialidase